jgi:hypothetical protein
MLVTTNRARRSRAAAGAVLTAALLAVAPAASAAPARYPARAPAAAANQQLDNIQAVSATDLWVLGQNDTTSAPLVWHGNGRSWTQIPVPGSMLHGGDLANIAATSPDSAWAVGTTGSSQTLILHWNGTAWSRQASPNAGLDLLDSATATSAGNAWAVGYTGDSPATDRTLILHWNGRKWSPVTSPKPLAGMLNAVTAVSADDAWAVGVSTTATGAHPKALVMHWNGKSWQRQAGAPAVAGGLLAVAATAKTAWAVGGTSGAPALTLHLAGSRWYVVPTADLASATLSGVVVASGGTVWADGISFFSNSYHGLVVRWNGSTWKAVPSPLQGAGNVLYAIGAGPSGSMWAVGDYWSSTTTRLNGTSMLWNGKKWREVPVPAPHSNNEELFGVTFVPGGTAWAVGRAWSRGTSPDLGTGGTGLYAVAATSTHNAWAVGFSWSTTAGVPPVIAILHWNGKIWS